MNDDFQVIYTDDDITQEPKSLIYQGKEYEWNGAFLIDLAVIKEMDIYKLPFDKEIQPIVSRPNKDTVELTEYKFTNTEEGLSVTIEAIYNSKYWKFPGVSLDRYLQNKVELVQISEIFKLDHFDNEDAKFIEFDFSFTIPHPSSMNEAISIIEDSLAKLEQKLMTKLKVPKKVKEEYCLYTKAN